MQHALDVGAALHARFADTLRHTEIGKFRFPTSQYVRLHLGDLTDFLRPEDRSIGNRGGGRSQRRQTR